MAEIIRNSLLGAIMPDPQKLRELAAWYREFAERTANPAIWEARLRMATALERAASRLERRRPKLGVG